MHSNTQLDTYTHAQANLAYDSSIDIAKTHPFFKDADAIASKHQASIQIVYHAIISAFITAYQNWVTVCDPRNEDGRVKISQFLITVAGSGEGKSLITDLLNKVFLEHQIKLDDAHRQATLKLKLEKPTWKAKKRILLSRLTKACKDDSATDIAELELLLLEHEEQASRDIVKDQLMFDGATAAGLKKSLASSSINPMVHSSEAIAFLKSLDEGFTTMLNRAWDGQPMAFETYNRKYDIADPRMSLSLLTQTDVFFKLVAGNTLLQDSGFWARCLISVASSYHPLYGPHHQPEDGKVVIARIHEKLRAQLEMPVARELTLSNTAKDRWLYIVDCIERGKAWQNSKESHTPAFAAKMPNHILRLAAAIHLAYEDGDVIDTASIDVATHLIKGFHKTQLRLFSDCYSPPQFYFDTQELYNWLIRKRSGYPFTVVSEIQHGGPTNSRNSASLQHQLDYLEKEHLIYRNKNGKSNEVFLNQPFYATPNILY